MKIICETKGLVNALNSVIKAVSTKTVLPILECVLIEAGDNGITLTSNNMELCIKARIDGEIQEKGIIALNARTFDNMVKSLPDGIVTISSNESFNTMISCEKTKFNICGQSGNDFPAVPEVERENRITINQKMLKDMIRQTLFSIAPNSQNKAMTGEYIEIRHGSIRITALDGHRIAIREGCLDQECPDNNIIIPGNTMLEVGRILSNDEVRFVTVYFGKNHAIFEFDNIVLVTRLIDDNYFDIEKLLSNNSESKVTVNRSELLKSVERAILLLKDGDKCPFITTVTNDVMKVETTTTLGSFSEDIEISKEGQDMKIAYNPRFIADILKVVEDEDITIYLTNPKFPAYIRNEDKSYNYIILPVNINS